MHPTSNYVAGAEGGPESVRADAALVVEAAVVPMIAHTAARPSRLLAFEAELAARETDGNAGRPGVGAGASGQWRRFDRHLVVIDIADEANEPAFVGGAIRRDGRRRYLDCGEQVRTVGQKYRLVGSHRSVSAKPPFKLRGEPVNLELSGGRADFKESFATDAVCAQRTHQTLPGHSRRFCAGLGKSELSARNCKPHRVPVA